MIRKRGKENRASPAEVLVVLEAARHKTNDFNCYMPVSEWTTYKIPKYDRNNFPKNYVLTIFTHCLIATYWIQAKSHPLSNRSEINGHPSVISKNNNNIYSRGRVQRIKQFIHKNNIYSIIFGISLFDRLVQWG